MSRKTRLQMIPAVTSKLMETILSLIEDDGTFKDMLWQIINRDFKIQRRDGNEDVA